MIASVGAYNYDDHLNPLTYRLVVAPPLYIYPTNTHYIDYHIKMNEIHLIDGSVRRFYDLKMEQGSNYTYERGDTNSRKNMQKSFIRLSEYYDIYTQYYDFTPQMFVGGRNLNSSITEERSQDKDNDIIGRIVTLLGGLGGILAFTILLFSIIITPI